MNLKTVAPAAFFSLRREKHRAGPQCTAQGLLRAHGAVAVAVRWTWTWTWPWEGADPGVWEKHGGWSTEG